MQLSTHAARNESKESTTTFVLLGVIGLADLLRVGGSVARSAIDGHGCDGLHTSLRGYGDIGGIVSVSVGVGDVGEGMTALCRLTSRVGVWTRGRTIDYGLVGCVG